MGHTRLDTNTPLVLTAEATPQASTQKVPEDVVEVPETLPATEEEIEKALSREPTPAPSSPTPSHQSSLSLGASASCLNSSQAHEVESCCF